MDGSCIKKFLTRNDGIYRSRENRLPSITHEEELKELEELEVGAVAGQKYIHAYWMY